MNLTRFQIHERLGSLSGEIKAARENRKECAADLESKERLTSLARQALEKADQQITDLIEEADRLKAAYADAIDELVKDDRPLSEVVAELREIAKDGDWGPDALTELQEIRSDAANPFADFGHPAQYTNGADPAEGAAKA